MNNAESNGGWEDLSSIARLAASAAWHTAGWSVRVPMRATRRALEVVAAPETAGDLVQEIRDNASAALRELIALADVDSRARASNDAAKKVAETVPGADVARRVAEAVPGGDVARKVVETIATPEAWLAPGDGRANRNGEVPLRVRGQELLDRSRDVHYEEKAHPAYERLMESLAPDEARILRLLLFKGPQPAVDVRTGGPLGLLQSRLLAPGLNMIGARAGCRYVERVPSYLTNLHRLGLIWFARETLRDPERYQVLEAQPDVLQAIHSVRYAKIVRRSIHLTPFGEDFCRAALVEDERQLVDLPEHASPAKPREPGPPELPV
jgi:Abortive infection alpha